MTGSLVGRVMAGYGDLRASFRAEAAALSEARLIFYAMLGCALVFLATLPATMARLPEGQTAVGYFAGQLVGRVLFGPLALYAFAAIAHLGARAFGGKGGWAASRLALFWSLLLAFPFVLAGEASVTLAGLRETLAGQVVATLPWVVYLWFWSVCLAEAEGFSRTGLVFLGLMTLPLAVAGLLWLAAVAG